MVAAAQIGLVLWVALYLAQLVLAMCELALLPVFALTTLLERPAELGFVEDLRGGCPQLRYLDIPLIGRIYRQVF